MKCTTCGEYIYKGRKFNARKETTSDTYLSIPIFRFYIRCTRCSAEITFKTDPKGMDYECERGARRNFEVWREQKIKDQETEEEMLDRLEREEGERSVMGELERKTEDARTEMAVADALDEVRVRNARRERVGDDVLGGDSIEVDMDEEEARRAEREIEEEARRAFASGTGERVRRVIEDGDEDSETRGLNALGTSRKVDGEKDAMPPPPLPAPTFQRQVKKKKDFSAALGIKKKAALV